MIDIFISYSRADSKKAELLVETLSKYGWTVWWDPQILPGKQFYKIIQESIVSAKCVIVLWSKHSIESDWVIEEAHIGKRRKNLIPVLIENVVPPLGFRMIQASNLVDWKPNMNHPEIDNLLDSITETAGTPVSFSTKKNVSQNTKTKSKSFFNSINTIFNIRNSIALALFILICIVFWFVFLPKQFPFVKNIQKSTLLVISKGCDGNICSTGTGFLVKPGFVSTTAHVIECSSRCEDIILIDYTGKKYEARIEAFSYKPKPKDLAILKINESALPPLKMTDYSEYNFKIIEDVKVATIGYKIPDLNLNSEIEISNIGRIVNVHNDNNLYITSGMYIYGTFSGGPVVNVKTGEIIGMAIDVLREIIVDGTTIKDVDYIVPTNCIRNFFIEKIGQDF